MKTSFCLWFRSLVSLLVMAGLGSTPVLTASAAVSWVSATNLWHFHKGTNSPSATWTNAPDSDLGLEWTFAPGGFGYGDDAIKSQSTTLKDMAGKYTTLYIRHSFTNDTPYSPSARVRLTVDYDDAFIAFLDGIEVARSSNAPAGHPDHKATASTVHEASCCNAPVNPPTVIDLGVAADLIPPGVHVLAIQGFNESLGSSDFHLIASLSAFDTNECPAGSICTNTVWKLADSPIALLSDTTVAPGVTLRIEAGVQVLFAPGISLRAGPRASIEVEGSDAAPVQFAIQNGTAVWGELAAEGTNSFLSIQHADIAGGAVKFRDGATGLIEDSYIHHYKSGTTPIAGCTRAKSVVVRRSHFNVYHETLWQFTPMLIEDSLFEYANNPSSDALDFDGAPPGSIIRRCTFRHGPQTNTDAIDIGSGSQGTLIEDCLMYDFPNDKGVSIGEASYGIVVRNCLVYGCDSGVAVKDGCTAEIYGCTFVENDYGFRNYNKADPASATGGGHITNSFNNILWNNKVTVSLLNASTLIADHTDFSATNWLGVANLSEDPHFINASLRDYRLASDSPLLSAARDGKSLGVQYPVGAVLAPSQPVISNVEIVGDKLRLAFWADPERTYTLLATTSLQPVAWSVVAQFSGGPLPAKVDHLQPLSEIYQFFKIESALKPAAPVAP